jgi:hypothetical protein
MASPTKKDQENTSSRPEHVTEPLKLEPNKSVIPNLSNGGMK